MALFLLDTDMLSHYQRNHPQVLVAIDSHGQSLGLCSASYHAAAVLENLGQGEIRLLELYPARFDSSSRVRCAATAEAEIRVRATGRVKYKGLRLVPTADGASIVLNKTGTIQILDAEDKELEVYNIVVGSYLHVADGGKIDKGAVLAQWDPYNIPVLSEKGGSLHFKDMIPGVTVKRELDESSGRIATIVIEHKEDLNPQIEVRDDHGKPVAAYSIPTGAQVAVAEAWRRESGPPGYRRRCRRA